MALKGRADTRADRRGDAGVFRLRLSASPPFPPPPSTVGIILGAAYMLWLYWRICFGTQRNADAAAMPDLSPREWWLLAPIALAVFWMGIYPESFLRPMRNDIGRLITRLERVQPAGDSKLTLGKGAVHMDMGQMH